MIGTMGGRLNAVSLLVSMVILLSAASGQSPCHTMSPSLDLITYGCLIQTSNDLNKIPQDAQALDLRLTSNHTVNMTYTVLPPRPSLVSLAIDVTHVEALKPGFFSHLDDLRTLSLYHTLPYTSQTPLLQLEEGVFMGLTTLTQLHLIELAFSTLPVGVFQGLDHLNYLDLNHNHLYSLPDDVFLGMPNLITLSLARNNINSLALLSFKHLERLEKLNLFGNDIRILPPGGFAGLDELKELSLTGNNLGEVQSGAFSGLTNLSSLYLDKNNLSEIPVDSFKHLPGLSQVLSLSDNRLTSLQSHTFDDLPQVSEINLADNYLTSLPDNVFTNLTALRILDLSGNNLEAIEVDHFEGLSQLERLYMNGNRLERLPHGLFDDLVSLTELDVSGNPFNCSCLLFWLPEWLARRQVSLISPGNTKCQSPLQVQNLALLQVHENNALECDERSTVTSTADAPVVTTSQHNASLYGADGTSGELSGAAKGGIVAGIFLLAILVVAATAIGIHQRQKRYNWSPSNDMDEDDRKMRLFYFARHKVPSVYRDPETGRVINVQEQQRLDAKATKANKKKKGPRVVISRDSLKAISEEEEYKSPDTASAIINNNNKVPARPRHLDIDDDMDYKFEIDVGTPHGVSPLVQDVQLKMSSTELQDHDSGISRSPDHMVVPSGTGFPSMDDAEGYDEVRYAGDDVGRSTGSRTSSHLPTPSPQHTHTHANSATTPSAHSSTNPQPRSQSQTGSHSSDNETLTPGSQEVYEMGLIPKHTAHVAVTPYRETSRERALTDDTKYLTSDTDLRSHPSDTVSPSV